MASRGNINNDYNNEEIHNDGFEDVIKFHPPIILPKPEKILVIDGDSIAWIVSYTGKDEFGNKKPDYTEDEYYIAEGLADEMFMKIINSCEEYFEIKNTYLCLKSENSVNPRYNWLPSYKQNRPSSLPIISHISRYLKEKHSGLSPKIGETDDLLCELVNLTGDKAIICSIDKDIKQLCNKGNGNWMLDYKKWEWNFVTPQEAKYLFHCQWITGDPGDNIIALSPGVGIKFAQKVLRKDMTDLEMFFGVWQAYMKAWKNDSQKAWENMQLAWKLLKLHTEQEFKQLN